MNVQTEKTNQLEKTNQTEKTEQTASDKHIVLKFNHIIPVTFIKLYPSQPKSDQLRKLIASYNLTLKFTRERKLNTEEDETVAFLLTTLTHQMNAICTESCYFHVVEDFIKNITKDVAIELRDRDSGLTYAKFGTFHVKHIDQEELFTVNKLIEKQYGMILIRDDWKDKK